MNHTNELIIPEFESRYVFYLADILLRMFYITIILISNIAPEILNTRHGFNDINHLREVSVNFLSLPSLSLFRAYSTHEFYILYNVLTLMTVTS